MILLLQINMLLTLKLVVIFIYCVILVQKGVPYSSIVINIGLYGYLLQAMSNLAQ